MKLYRKIIHPYKEIDGRKYSISEYEGRWFSEESKQKVMDSIYNTYCNRGESKVVFFRRYGLKWETKYKEVSFTTSMDDKIEELTT